MTTNLSLWLRQRPCSSRTGRRPRSRYGLPIAAANSRRHLFAARNALVTRITTLRRERRLRRVARWLMLPTEMRKRLSASLRHSSLQAVTSDMKYLEARSAELCEYHVGSRHTPVNGGFQGARLVRDLYVLNPHAPPWELYWAVAGASLQQLRGGVLDRLPVCRSSRSRSKRTSWGFYHAMV